MSKLLKSTLSKKSIVLTGNVGNIDYNPAVETEHGTKARCNIAFYAHEGDKSTIYHATMWGRNADDAKEHLNVGAFCDLTCIPRKDKVLCNDGITRNLMTATDPVFQLKHPKSRIIL